MATKEKCAHSPSDGDLMEWSAEEEIQLFFALEGLKPVGVNKHFYMMCIAERLSKSLNRDVQTKAIWAHLRTLYNLDVLDELEPIPFPNGQKDFSLPDTEFSLLISKKILESDENKCVLECNMDVSAPASIIAVVTDNTTKDKSGTSKTPSTSLTREIEKKLSGKLVDVPKRTPKRTRGSMSLESNSPSTTPPPIQSHKRRRL